MFAKLLKHELKATGGMLGLLSLAAVVMGVVGGFLVRLNMNAPAAMEAYEVLSLVSSFALPVIMISLMAYAFGSMIYLAVQFYKRKFTDEGYLTFTLPVRAWQIYLSSMLNIVLWSILIVLVLLFSLGAMFFIGIFDTKVWHMMTEQFSQLGQDFSSLGDFLDAINPLYYVMEFLSGNVLMITCITLGSVLAKKHKILGAIGSYYAVSLLMGAVNTWITGIFMDSVELSFDTIYLISALLNGAVIVVGSALSIYLMDRKLNLP